MYNAIFCICHHILRSIHELVYFQNFVTIRRAMWSKQNILGCLSNRNKGGMANCCISMFGFRGYLLENDCYASMAGVSIQIQYGSVSRSRQLLRCMGTRLNLMGGGGGDITDFCLAVPKRLTVGR